MISAFAFSQGIGIGQWRDHLPYNEGITVAKVNNKIYCSTPYCLFYYNKEDNSINKLNKINGLSDFGVSCISYHKNLDILFIAYTNGNIDLLQNNHITNIPDIKRANLLGKKTINNIYFKNDLAYLSCGFGIVVLDLVKEEVHDTYYIGPQGNQIEVYDLTINDTSIFAGTEEGLYIADVDNPNLANFAAWSRSTAVPHYESEFRILSSYEDYILTNIKISGTNKDTLFKFDGQLWKHFDTDNITSTNNINSSDGLLLISESNKLLIYDNSLSLLYSIDVSHLPGYSGYLDEYPNDALIDNDVIWSADQRNGLVKITEWGTFAESIKPSGPPSIDAYDMDNAGDDIWVAPGGKSSVWSAAYNSKGLFLFHDEEWEQYEGYGTPEIYGIHDFITVSSNPYDPGNVFAGAFRNDSSLVEFDNYQVVNVYDDENSSLQLWQAAGSIAVTGLDFDSYGNLWVANSGAPDILSVRINDGTNNGEWHAFNLGSSLTGVDIGELIVDNYDQKWIIKRKTIENPYYIIVFKDNNTIDDPSDDQVKGLTNSSGSGNIPGNKIYSIAVDQDGEIWIGSDNGISVIYNPENVFTGGNYDAERIIIPRNDGSGLGDILLENEFVTSITVDGDNNKWIGTDDAGVFLLSEDGMEEIYHFTEEDSPLFSNLISTIAINDNGEVFFGTSLGIISFRSKSTPAEPTFEDVYAYPNPVREGYTGSIGIKGLVKDANVKITDISGNLIYETRSLGGQAIWNGKNLQGRRAHTGVYLVFVSNDDGSQTLVTKILVIN